jgi:hypothetical protein
MTFLTSISLCILIFSSWKIGIEGFSSPNGWVNLMENNSEAPVKKWTIENGSGSIPSKGSIVEIDYVGTFGPSPETWTVEDVVEAWLKPQQGLYDLLQEQFRRLGVDGKVLCNPDLFNEAFISDMGVTNKIQNKKTVMAAKRLIAQMEDPAFAEGVMFDSTASRQKHYEFVLGAGKTIKATDLLVSSMSIGEKARVQARCDFCYGSEGYRKKSGEVLVPPFATLCFDVTLISTK